MNACARVHTHEGVKRACVSIRAFVYARFVYARLRLCVRFERCVRKRTCEHASSVSVLVHAYVRAYDM